MVGRRVRIRRDGVVSLPLVLIGIFVLSTVASAQDLVVEARVDRPTVRENESFTYTIRAEGRVRGEPDASPLEQQFDILSRTSSTRIQIINGQTEQIAEWVYQLMPTRSGQFTLLPLQLDAVLSNAVDLEVLPALVSSDQPADIFMEVEAEPTTPYVQSQVIYTLRLFVGVGTGRATLTAPQVSGGEAIVERLGEDRQYQVTRGDRNFIVRERRYAIFPQETGPLTIGPTTFEAMVIPNRGFSRVQRLRSASLELAVQAAVSPPAEFASAVWLPARDLTLNENWADQEREFSLGVPRTRTLTIEALGVLETQLPELESKQAQGIRQYPDQPVLDREITERGLQGRRLERYAVIAQSAGEVEIPGAELPWWNIDTGRWEVATIDPRVVSVSPGAEPDMILRLGEDQPVSEVVPPEASSYWPVLSAGLALGWITTLLLWLRSRSAPAKRRGTPAIPRRATNRRLLRQLRAASARNDADEVHRLLILWAELRFPESPPQSLGVLAEKLPEAVAAEILRLESHLYGRERERWNGQALRELLAQIDSVSRPGTDRDSDALRPLYR